MPGLSATQCPLGIRVVIVQYNDVNSVSSSMMKLHNCCRSAMGDKVAAKQQAGVPVRRSKRLQILQQQQQGWSPLDIMTLRQAVHT